MNLLDLHCLKVQFLKVCTCCTVQILFVLNFSVSLQETAVSLAL